MKSLFTFILLLSFFFSHAQSVNDNVNLKPLLFKKFIAGVVFMKDGTYEKANFNYNTDNQKVVFIADNKYLEVAGLENIDSLFIDNLKFIVIDNYLYETTSKNFLFVTYTNKVIPKGVNTDKGGTEKVEKNRESNNLTDAYAMKTFQQRSDLIFQKNFWIRKDNKLYPISSPRQFAKFFELDKKATAEYADAYNLTFYDEASIFKLIKDFKVESKLPKN